MTTPAPHRPHDRRVDARVPDGAPRPPTARPTCVIVLLDDIGFAQLGCFGSDIETPTFDRLAADGLRYHRFHVTALCSPTRAALLTGRNHHSVGMGFLTDVPIGFPGYNGRIPESAATLPRVLRDAGYNTIAVGKWHLAPRWDQHAVGPVRPLAARPRASSATTASSPATPTSGRPTSSATTPSSSRRARPRRATTSPRTWPTRRSA